MIVGPYFGMFVCIWIYLRHFINLKIIWAVLTTFRTIGPFELNWETQQYKCWISQYITFSLLATLQAINLVWLFYILRIAKNYVFSNVRQDERSDDEDEEDEEDEKPSAKDEKATPNGRVSNGCGCKDRDAAAVRRKDAKKGPLQNGNANGSHAPAPENEKTK